MNYREGEVLLFDKPYKWTSFQLVNKVRWLLCRKFDWKKLKVGHAGTLDPLATGLMVLCTGKATKQIPSLIGFDKEYIAEIKLGETTPSYDLETEVDNTYPTEHITRELFESVLDSFKGEIDQVPPVFSAKQVNGTRAYEFARKGIDLELKAAKVVINKLEIINFEMPYVSLLVSCSKGTYIRSLARDIGKLLNSGAYLSGLKRTRIGEYKLTDAISVENFEKSLSEM
ncbi:MAG: tRNA pseudouridine(55) synthase TruB [Bacteroidales bacterium]|nr:tRNA pseudouridine(55) synthase TruB [Bacteroidales bacterium]MBN2818066.1 tRNA pseudouridine(55) synthase TruB [Bacteroidales bacterium]